MRTKLKLLLLLAALPVVGMAKVGEGGQPKAPYRAFLDYRAGSWMPTEILVNEHPCTNSSYCRLWNMDSEAKIRRRILELIGKEYNDRNWGCHTVNTVIEAKDADKELRCFGGNLLVHKGFVEAVKWSQRAASLEEYLVAVNEISGEQGTGQWIGYADERVKRYPVERVFESNGGPISYVYGTFANQGRRTYRWDIGDIEMFAKWIHLPGSEPGLVYGVFEMEARRKVSDSVVTCDTPKNISFGYKNDEIEIVAGEEASITFVAKNTGKKKYVIPNGLGSRAITIENQLGTKTTLFGSAPEKDWSQKLYAPSYGLMYGVLDSTQNEVEAEESVFFDKPGTYKVTIDFKGREAPAKTVKYLPKADYWCGQINMTKSVKVVVKPKGPVPTPTRNPSGGDMGLPPAPAGSTGLPPVGPTPVSTPRKSGDYPPAPGGDMGTPAPPGGR